MTNWEQMVLLIQYIVLGIVQGFTEPIPISSSGHLVIIEHLFGLHFEGLSFETLLNSASLLAVLVIYREDIKRLALHFCKYLYSHQTAYKSDFTFVLYLALATVPAAVIGLLFNDLISDTLKGIKVIGVTLIVTGIALWLIRNLRGRRHDQQLTARDAIIVGLAQAIALIPGISRSGATIVAAMGLKMKQDTALRFSFLMYIPVSIGGLVLEGSRMASDPDLNTLWPAYTLAFLVCFAASYVSLRWFMGIMQRGNLKYFSYYCFAVGLVVLLFL